jgi:RNA polymerase sigma factor (sigma-70 family)
MIAKQRTVRRNRIARSDVVRRAERILRAEPQFIYHSSFDAPQAEEEILRDGLDTVRRSLAGRRAGSDQAERNADFYVAFLYRTDPLSRDEEFVLFRRMNYLKFRAHRLRQRLDPASATIDEVEAIEQLEAEAVQLRNFIVECNLRLVTARAKQFSRTTGLALDELISEGNIGLVQAVQHFDFSRGTKLSTYATWAISNKLLAYYHRSRRQMTRFAGETLDGIEAVDGEWESADEQLANQEVREAISSLLDQLKERERLAVVTRFGLDESADPATLKDLAQEWGVTKQRAQQVCAGAVDKLRSMLQQAGFAPATE